MAHGIDLTGRDPLRRGRAACWLTAGLLAMAAAACYPNPDDLRGGGKGSGGSLGASGGAPGGLGGTQGGTGGQGIGGTPGGLGGAPAGAGGSGSGGSQLGIGGRVGTGGAGVGGRIGTGGSIAGVGGRIGVGGSGSGGSTGARCGAPPCGGDVVGTWDVSQTCTSPTHESTSCPGQTTDLAGIQRVGFITFTAGGSYSSTVTDSGSYVVDTPNDCLTSAQVTCDELQAAWQEETQPPQPTLASASCTSSATSCRCVLGVIPAMGSESGLYGVLGTKITTTATMGSTLMNTNDYCVTGTTLRLIFPDSTPNAPQESVFQKR